MTWFWNYLCEDHFVFSSKPIAPHADT